MVRRGPGREKPISRGWAAAIVENPFAGRYVEDLAPFMASRTDADLWNNEKADLIA